MSGHEQKGHPFDLNPPKRQGVIIDGQQGAFDGVSLGHSQTALKQGTAIVAPGEDRVPNLGDQPRDQYVDPLAKPEVVVPVKLVEQPVKPDVSKV